MNQHEYKTVLSKQLSKVDLYISIQPLQRVHFLPTLKKYSKTYIFKLSCSFMLDFVIRNTFNAQLQLIL